MTSEKKSLFKKIWYFIWEDNSIWSWIVNVILAFLIIKFLVYPALGLGLGTSYPIVAVISSSMDHALANGEMCGKYPVNYQSDLEDFWRVCGDWYEERDITFEQFKEFPLKNGFKKGDLIVLKGRDPKDINIGDIIVFQASDPRVKPEPIIHRIVKKTAIDSEYIFQTKGDHNKDQIDDFIVKETYVSQDRLLGKGWFKIPYLGYVKILFVDFINIFRR
ncbi:signal peptidase I [Candidatus Woesearchaeota archaeon]|nr:signal peptidase I [Candidatus Woesearchaeota archaeon]